MSTSYMTTDHDEIRAWAEERGGKPSAVKGTSHGDDDPGIIRIDFPGFSGEGKLEEIPWEEFFEKFEESGLALIVQAETKDGEKSNFNKFVKRDKEENQAKTKGASDGKAKGSDSKAKGSDGKTKGSGGGSHARK